MFGEDAELAYWAANVQMVETACLDDWQVLVVVEMEKRLMGNMAFGSFPS